MADSLTAAQRSDGTLALAAASGGDGMVAGQVLDIMQMVPDEVRFPMSWSEPMGFPSSASLEDTSSMSSLSRPGGL